MFLSPAFWTYIHPSPHKRAVQSPTTEQTLANALADIDIIRSLLPSLPESPKSLRAFKAALRVSAILYIPYVVLTYLVPLNVLVGIAGTFVLVYRAKWAQTIREALTRSSHLQKFARYAWARIIGAQGTVAQTPKPSTLKVTSRTPKPSAPQRFLFTLFECQRWWVGLDWTAALLPGERPSWCNVAQQPVSPPSAFELPSPTTVYLPGLNGKRIKRVARWCWEDQQWGIIVNKDGGDVRRIERSPPGIGDEDDKDNSSRLKRAAALLRERSMTAATEKEKEKEKDESPVASNIPDAEDVATDLDGWVYGDNKWEATTAKGGLGKYTRYRRWTRIALLEETVEEVGPGALGITQSLMRNGQITEVQAVITDATALADTKNSASVASSSNTSKAEFTVSNSTTSPTIDIASTQSSPGNVKGGQATNSLDEASVALRERLKSAIKNAR
jgi:hypothetical protein